MTNMPVGAATAAACRIALRGILHLAPVNQPPMDNVRFVEKSWWNRLYAAFFWNHAERFG